MLKLYRRNKVFWISNCDGGQQIRESLHTRDTEVAKALLRQREIDLLSGGRLKQIRWPEYQEEFLQWAETQVKPNTVRGYRITAKRFGKFLETIHSPALTAITPTTISAFVEARKDDRHPSWNRAPGPGGIRFDMRCLHRIFAYGVECNYIHKNPVRARKLNSPAGQTMPFSAEEITRMLDDLARVKNLQLRAIVLTFVYTGLRISDVTALTKKSIAHDVLILETIKRGRAVSIRIHSQLREAIELHLAAQSPIQKKSPLLFCTENGKPIVSLARDLGRVWRRCDIVGAHAHRFRDTFAVRLLTQGATIYDVAKLLGIGVQTCDRYYSPYVRELQERGAKFIEQLAAV